MAVLTSIATSHVGISHSFEDLQHDQTELNPSAKSGGGNSVSALGDRTQVDQDLDDHHTSWMIQLSLNLICYASIFVPGYYLRWRYLKRGGATQEDRGKSWPIQPCIAAADCTFRVSEFVMADIC